MLHSFSSFCSCVCHTVLMPAQQCRYIIKCNAICAEAVQNGAEEGKDDEAEVAEQPYNDSRVLKKALTYDTATSDFEAAWEHDPRWQVSTACTVPAHACQPTPAAYSLCTRCWCLQHLLLLCGCSGMLHQSLPGASLPGSQHICSCLNPFSAGHDLLQGLSALR